MNDYNTEALKSYNTEALKSYIREYGAIAAHIPSDATSALAEAYAMVYLHIRINEVLALGGGLHTNA